MTATRRYVRPATTPILPGDLPGPILDVETDGHLATDIIGKANAGARLFFALYHHPQAKELFSSPLMSAGLLKAYMAAARAWDL